MMQRLLRQSVLSKKTIKNPDEATEVITLEAEIDRQIGDLVPQKARDEVVRRVSTTLTAEFFSGPIAHPRHLREYENISPGAADRIISMAENQNNHEMDVNNKILDAEIADRRLGMILGACSFAGLVLCALISAIYTKGAIVPGLFLTAAAIGAVSTFINGRKNGN